MKVSISIGLSLVICALLTKHSYASDEVLVASDYIFIQGAPLVGGSQGMYFDEDNNLIVAHVYGRTISTINPETGDILGQLGFEDGVGFVDDVTVGPDGTLYWSDFAYFQTIFAKSPGGPAIPLYEPGSIPFANPVTLSDDGTRLYFAQCWNPEPTNGVFELDLETNTTTTLVDGVFGCSSNAMDIRDDELYTPRPYEGRVVKIDLANNYTISNVTTGWGGAPQALKFDSKGNLYATNSGIGEVARVNLTDPDTDNNRELVAQFPPGWIDNLAIDKDDRLYVSSGSEGTILEVLSSGGMRTASDGGSFSVPMGVAVLNKTLFTVHPGALFGFDIETGERTLAIRSVPDGDLFDPTAVVAWEDRLVLCSFPFGGVNIYDPFKEESIQSAFFAEPIDAHPFQGDLLVTEFATGNVVRASAADMNIREVIATVSGAAFLAGDDNNVYLTNYFNGTVLQIIQNGEVLTLPVVITSDFDAPEGIALHGGVLLVVDGGSETLKEVDLVSGEVRTIAKELAFFPGIPGFPLGYVNDAVVDETGAIYMNGDRTSVIYKFPPEDSMETSAAGLDGINLLHHALLTGFILLLLG